MAEGENCALRNGIFEILLAAYRTFPGLLRFSLLPPDKCRENLKPPTTCFLYCFPLTFTQRLAQRAWLRLQCASSSEVNVQCQHIQAADLALLWTMFQIHQNSHFQSKELRGGTWRNTVSKKRKDNITIESGLCSNIPNQKCDIQSTDFSFSYLWKSIYLTLEQNYSKYTNFYLPWQHLCYRSLYSPSHNVFAFLFSPVLIFRTPFLNWN